MNEDEKGSLEELEQLALELESTGDDRVAVLKWAYDIVVGYLNQEPPASEPEDVNCPTTKTNLF